MIAGLRTWWRTAGILVAICFRADPWRASAMFTCDAASNIAMLVSVYSIRLVVDGIVATDEAAVVRAAVLLAVTALLATALSGGYLRLVTRVIDQSMLEIDRLLMRLTAGIPTIAHHELPRFADELTLIRQERQAMSQMMNAIVLNLRIAVALVGAVVLLAVVDPVLMLLPVFGVPALIGHQITKRRSERARQDNAVPTRRRAHLFDVASSASAGKELRLFGLADELAARHRVLSDDMNARARRASLTGVARHFLGSVAFAVGYGLAVLVVVAQAARGDTAIGSVVLVISLAALVNSQVSSAATYGTYLQQVTRTARRLVWLTDYAADAAAAPADAAVPAALTDGIVLDEVSFTYPGTQRTVLDRVSVRLPAGSVIAVVGENGSGKTTLVKLLGRFYTPDSGTVRADGTDIARFDIAYWRRRMTGGFQDFVNFELTLGEAVGIGDLAHADDPAQVERALTDAGASDLTVGLPAGLDTQLGKQWPGGVQLSGGQWQKVALGRTLMRTEPLLAIFDEPTAALDAPTEFQLFQSLAETARERSRLGAVTVFVSHRFSTVRSADLIIVLDGGRVAEQGSHAELIRAGGLYAEMYQIQARAYR